MATGLRAAVSVVRRALLAALLPAATVIGRSLPAQVQRAGDVAAAPDSGGSPATAAAPMRVDALVATRRLARGTVLQPSDMARARIPARLDAAGRPRPDTVSALPGWIARRVIQPGEVLRPPAVAPAPLVAAGQAVRFTYRHDGLALSLDGVAPVAGALGDTIPVRLGARRRLTGVVAGPAHVIAIDLPRTP